MLQGRPAITLTFFFDKENDADADSMWHKTGINRKRDILKDISKEG